MLSALYYPHTEVQSQIILKNALLLWDELQTIVPRSVRASRDASPLEREAVELVVSPRVPSTGERQAAHDALFSLLESGQLQSMLATAPGSWAENTYSVYHEKFLYETWRVLEERGLASIESVGSGFKVTPALGFLMLSLLADSCAGTTLQRVTDRGDAHSWLLAARASALGLKPVVGLDVSQIAPAHDRLVTLSLQALDARHIPLKRLVELRKRERKSGGGDYAAMRKRYLASLNSHVARVAKETRSASDLRELERQFREEIRADVQDLKKELGIASVKTLFSKEVALSTLAVGGALIAPVSGLTTLSALGLAGVIPLVKSAVELRAARREAIKKHASSWLFFATSPRLQVR